VTLDALGRFIRGRSAHETATLFEAALYNPEVARDVRLAVLGASKRKSQRGIRMWLAATGFQEPGEEPFAEEDMPPVETYRTSAGR